MAVSLTASARERVSSFLRARGHGIGLRLAVKKTGCSGFAYVVNYADDVSDQDVVFEQVGDTASPVAPAFFEKLWWYDQTVFDTTKAQ